MMGVGQFFIHIHIPSSTYHRDHRNDKVRGSTSAIVWSISAAAVSGPLHWWRRRVRVTANHHYDIVGHYHANNGSSVCKVWDSWMERLLAGALRQIIVWPVATRTTTTNCCPALYTYTRGVGQWQRASEAFLTRSLFHHFSWFMTRAELQQQQQQLPAKG